MKPTLKAPGSKRLKLWFDEPLSSFAFNFNLRRYIKYPPYYVVKPARVGTGFDTMVMAELWWGRAAPLNPILNPKS